jgi:hypothetical protein
MQPLNQPQKNRMQRFIERTRFRFIQAARKGETFRTVIYEKGGEPSKNCYWVNKGFATMGAYNNISHKLDNWIITDLDTELNPNVVTGGCRMIGESFVENGIPGLLIQTFNEELVTVEKYCFDKDSMFVNQKGGLVIKAEDSYIRFTFSLN